jgi:hypothetical protein
VWFHPINSHAIGAPKTCLRRWQKSAQELMKHEF